MEPERPVRANRIPLILSLIALAAVFLVVRWVVLNNRHDGAMTPIDAQGMDMTTMKPPPGAYPVGVETVGRGTASGRINVPGSVVAFSDEDVVARVSGRVEKVLVYPGDRVKAGQLLATLDADELALEAAAARLEGQAGQSRVAIAQREISRLLAERDAATADVSAHAAHERETRAARTAASADAAGAKEAWNAKAAMIADRQAALTYAEKNLVREKNLFDAGAISRDEYEQAVASRDSAAAQLRSALAESEASKRAADAAQSRVLIADSTVAVAIGEHTAARMRIAAIDQGILKARAEVVASQADAAAISAGAGSAGIVAGYRNLRALDSAVVSERVVSPGSIVQPGQTILRLKVMNKVRIQAKVPGRHAGEVRQGTPLTLTIGSKTRVGNITSVFPAQDAMTRTFTVEAVIDNSQGLFQPGAFVNVELQTSGAREGLSVRSEAIQADAIGNSFVWALKKREAVSKTDWTCTMHPEISESGPGICPICKMDLSPRQSTAQFIAIRKPVVTGPSSGRTTIIVSGIAIGDRVIFGGTADLVEGSPVAPVAWGENGPAELPKSAANE
ncbi:MAG: efflux RND transporter periplasmic adaptor subunit [Armatimonadota bacterium]|nr:efflux RND transporter periplasmic adaptor subunit [Armatimonadota bacterium]